MDDSDPDDDLSGQAIARLFAEQAAKVLDTSEFEMLLDFLNKPPPMPPLERLHNPLVSSIKEFHRAEIQESRGPWDRLAVPSGPENASLGIVMHLQTKKGRVGEFWGNQNSSIQALEKKGLSKASMFGFDWHWRAEDSARNRGICSASKLSKVLSSLHDSMSSSILDFRPLPFLIVAGSCPKKSYRKPLSDKAKSIYLIVKAYSTIEFVLDYRSDGLRRITAFMDHPAACYYRPKEVIENAISQDAVVNLFLWLLNRRSSRTAFSEVQTSKTSVGRGGMEELHYYVEVKKKQRRRLEEEEYEPGFLFWAAIMSEEDPIRFLEQGLSIAEATKTEICRRQKAA